MARERRGHFREANPGALPPPCCICGADSYREMDVHQAGGRRACLRSSGFCEQHWLLVGAYWRAMDADLQRQVDGTQRKDAVS